MKYVIPIVIIVLALLGANGIYVVGEGHAAVLSRFGNVEATQIGPGLHFKLPFVQAVTLYDTREIVSQSEPGDCKTRDGHAVRVGFFVRWKVADPAAWFKATGGAALQTSQQMLPMVRDALAEQVAAYDRSDLLSSNGQDIGAAVRGSIGAAVRQKLGVEVLQVGISRVLPPEAALASVYKRMNAEAGIQVGTVRAEGEAAAAAVQAKGDEASQQVLAVANQAAAAVRGSGDADAAKIYAAASAKDPQFFRYWSSLYTWRQSFKDGGAVVVLGNGSPFIQAVDAGAASDNAATKKP